MPLGQARVARAGADLTIVSIGKGVRDALAAAEQLAADGIDAEVIDLRTLRPLDLDDRASSRSRRRTGCSRSRRARAPAAGRPACSAPSPSAALHDLDDAWIVATDETPVPYSPTLEDAFMPSTAAIVESVRTRLGAGVGVMAVDVAGPHEVVSRVPTGLYIGGEWREATGGGTLRRRGSRHGRGRSPRSPTRRPQDALAALDAACAAQAEWAQHRAARARGDPAPAPTRS